MYEMTETCVSRFGLFRRFPGPSMTSYTRVFRWSRVDIPTPVWRYQFVFSHWEVSPNFRSKSGSLSAGDGQEGTKVTSFVTGNKTADQEQYIFI